MKKWFQYCKSCKHGFYVPVTLANRVRDKIKKVVSRDKWSRHRAKCPVCGSKKNVRVIRIMEKGV